MTIDANGFDRDYYLRENPDIAAAGVDPYRHYLDFGWREGRDPNAIFDVGYYLAASPDVAAARIDPLAHYLASGWREGRDPSVAFDTSDYRQANPDVAQAGLNPLLHYLTYGQAEHRVLTLYPQLRVLEGFDNAYYLAANPDVARAGVDPYLHYQQNGMAEGRAPNALFDAAFYLARNPDVAAAGMDAFQHYLAYGWREGRDPSARFSLAEYQATVGREPGSTGGGTSDSDPLVRYLAGDRYVSLPSDLIGSDQQVVQSRGQPLRTILAGDVNFAVAGALIHVTADASPLDGHDLSGFTEFALGRSIADITIDGTGRLPTGITLGAGDDRIGGAFDLGGQILNLFANGGSLIVDARFDNGYASINGGTAGSIVTTSGSATVNFAGGAGADVVTLGAGNDALAGGAGINRLDGGAGTDTASWTTAVRADLSTGRAVSIGTAVFSDTLTGIENLGGSGFDDILIGDDRANTFYGVNVSPGPGGNDILAGRGGDDVLWGMDGDDILLGGRGADILIGGEGDDLLVDAADGWGANDLNPTAVGNEGDDRLVYLLGAVGEEARGNFMDGGTGADTYIIDPAAGRWGSLGLQFSPIDGDRLDLSALRTLSGGTVTLDDVRAASSTPFSGSTTIDLAAFHDAAGHALSGRIVLNGVFAPADLRADDLILTSGSDWRSALSADLLPLI
ncbi:calcium-binding protein [Sphingomonas solaris]|uniref:Calcium-binding protein n=1 Tax=Alterirhizorhabdus solaris TaxID=2529389 RepID=A0A558R7K0_9SPHN|nr:calcium-binding protein [Sphingomonas solaris]TVV75375.1 calcium-binding protein [Sphingomonas solaris]